MIDLKAIIGEPYKNVTEMIYIDGQYVPSKQKEVINIEFISNGVILLFVMIVCSNILLRTIFPKKRG